jgi:ribosomal-protein-alanine N-acetyltransferase
VIRDAHPEDLAALQAIQSSALAEPWPELLEIAVSGPQTLLVHTDESAGDGRRDTPIAYALAIVADGRAYLAEFAVAPSAQGDGRGSELLAALVDQFRAAGLDEIRLTARAGDDRVHDFYRRFDFERRQRIEGHYEDGDGLLFVRSLE